MANGNPKSTTDLSRYRVPILDRALAVVELLGQHPAGLNVTELSENLQIPKNSAFRIAVTLQENGYLERLETSKRYRLTSKFIAFGATAVSEANLFEKSLGVMRELRDKLRETVLLGTRIGIEGVVLDQVPGTYAFRFAVDPGVRFPLHTAAPGKAMLAYLPRKERAAILAQMRFKRFTPNTITNAADFEADLTKTRERGYGFDLSEEMEGQYCIGAPIFDAKNLPAASIWITAPSTRLPDSQLDEVGRLIRSHADVISTRLGWIQPSVTE
jgi:IclR family acetate operon transcriptional repressor